MTTGAVTDLGLQDEKLIVVGAGPAGLTAAIYAARVRDPRTTTTHAHPRLSGSRPVHTRTCRQPAPPTPPRCTVYTATYFRKHAAVYTCVQWPLSQTMHLDPAS